MKRSNRLVLLIGIFLALVAFVLIVLLLGNGTNGGGATGPSASPTIVKVVVASKDIDLGARIQATDVSLKDIPAEAKPETAFADTSLVIGQIARVKVTAGQLVTSAVFGTGGAVTDIEVPKGFVAISVRVDQTTGVGTVIKPGDFVDVVSGFTGDKLVIPNLDLTTKDIYVYDLYPSDQFAPTTVKVLAQGLQVLGTLLPPAPESTQPEPSATPSTGGGTTTFNGQEQIVILAVPTQTAELLKFSQIDGNISLVLRSPEDCTTEPLDGLTYCPTIATTGITLRRMVDDYGVLPPTVVQVIEPTPLPGTVPEKTPKP